MRSVSRMLNEPDAQGAELSRRIAVSFGGTFGSGDGAVNATKWKPQPNGKERLGSGNGVLQSGKCDKRTATRTYGDCTASGGMSLADAGRASQRRERIANG
jgi:hypothetical protein